MQFRSNGSINPVSGAAPRTKVPAEGLVPLARTGNPDAGRKVAP